MKIIQKLNLVLSVLPAVYPKTSKTLMFIGLLVLIRKIVKLVQSIYAATLRRRRNFAKRYGANSWALITGSSEGIGKGIATSLAHQGFNIILSARS
jgi:17beta-estradiol 17-dehydrogenase / very-long-chain 3-oxoacyl-CoA reductase